MRTLDDMQNEAAGLQQRATALQTMVYNEGREYNEQEAADFDNTISSLERLSDDIGRHRKLQQLEQHLQEPAAPRVTNAITPVNNGASRPNGKAPNGGTPPYRVEVASRLPGGTHGFQNMGEFAQSVKEACIGGRVDMRLLNAGPPNVMTEGVNADGGYAVPPDFRPDIQVLIQGEDSLLPYTDQLTTSSNAITLTVDATSPWQGTGGIQCYWGPEAGQKTTSKAVLSPLICRLFKLYSLIAVSDELLEDAPALGALIRSKAPQKMAFAINAAILAGNGTTQPLGILNSGAAIAVARSTPGVVDMADILRMWAACYGPSRRRAVWITNQDVESSLMSLFFPIPPTTPTGGWPVYLPPGGLSAAPFGTLLGRPVLVTEAAQDMGVKGDLILADLSQYLTATKAGGIRTDISIHLWFDWDCSAFRLVYRIGGCPFWSAPVDSHWGTRPRSPFVVLDGTAVQPVGRESNAPGGTLSGATTTHTAGAAAGPGVIQQTGPGTATEAGRKRGPME